MPSYKCNLIIPGFPKCGTSSFHEYLDSHPLICMSRPKECHYFARDSIWKKGVDFHNSLFVRGEESRYFGESSTIHCISDLAIERIKNSLADPKIIFLIRSPVARAVSHYKWLYKSGIETRSFRLAINESGYEFDPEKPIGGTYKGYLEFSNYSGWIPKWQCAFGAGNVLLIRSEGLRKRQGYILDGCANHLGIPTIDWNASFEVGRTDAAVMSTERTASRILRRIVPKKIKQRISTTPVMARMWRNYGLRKKEIIVPVVRNDDIEWLSRLLLEQLEYYEEIFSDDSDMRVF